MYRRRCLCAFVDSVCAALQGKGTSADELLELISSVKQRIKKETGVELQEEILRIPYRLNRRRPQPQANNGEGEAER